MTTVGDEAQGLSAGIGAGAGGGSFMVFVIVAPVSVDGRIKRHHCHDQAGAAALLIHRVRIERGIGHYLPRLY